MPPGATWRVGEGQPLGSPLSFGGPGLGLFATTTALMRRIPGRLVGRTVDEDGRIAYTLTLRTREQDIRREKASSNICTNQGLNALGAAVHLAWLGPRGLAETGRQSVQKAHYLAERLGRHRGRRPGDRRPLRPGVRPASARRTRRPWWPRWPTGATWRASRCPPTTRSCPRALLVAVTEKRTRAELDGYAAALEEVLHDA